MKNLFYPLFFLVSFLSYGQDYQLFNASSRKVFRTTSDLAETYSLVFDSVVMQGSDYVYFPYKSLSDSGYYSDTCYMWNNECYFMNFPTWMGSHVQKAGDVYNFFTLDNAILSFNFNLAPLQSHVFFQDSIQRFMINRMSPGIDTMNVLGINDSVIRYQISHTDLQGNIIDSPLNSWQIIIGKQLGLISFFRVDVFPSVLVPLTLMGNESPDAGFYQVTNATIYNYSPGDKIQYSQSYNYPLNPQLNTLEYITETFLERIETTDSLKYKVYREVYVPDSSQYSTSTLWVNFKKDIVIADIPFDRIESEMLLSSDLKIQDYCGLQLWTYNNFSDSRYLMYCTEENSWCGFDVFGYTDNDIIYVEGLGIYDLRRGTPGPITNSSFYQKINYFKKNGTECGELIVGINDKLLKNAITTISPNPATEFFYISESMTSSNLIIYDQNGSIVLNINNYQSGEKVDISAFVPGCYMVRLIDGKTCRNGKLIKR